MHAALVTASDTVDLPAGSSSLSFSNTGSQTLHITTLGGEDITITGLASGMWPIRAKRVWSTGTTVTNIVAYWI
jgi:hypothetical protein